jgi:hypothetical protein
LFGFDAAQSSSFLWPHFLLFSGRCAIQSAPVLILVSAFSYCQIFVFVSQSEWHSKALTHELKAQDRVPANVLSRQTLILSHPLWCESLEVEARLDS